MNKTRKSDTMSDLTLIHKILIGIAAVLLIILILFIIFVAIQAGSSFSGQNMEQGVTESSEHLMETGTESERNGITDAEAGVQAADTESQTLASHTKEADRSETLAEAQNISLSYQDFVVTLPASWQGKYGVTQGVDYYQFYQQASKTAEGGGVLFTIYSYLDTSYTELPDYEILGTGNGKALIWTLPTDVQAAEDMVDEYEAMRRDLDWIRSNIRVLILGDGPQSTETQRIEPAETASTDSSGYLPQSSERLLTDEDIAGMNADDLQMAINEIYARHGRIFKMQSVREYFEKQSWYHGTVTEENFSDSVFSATEKQNILFLVDRMNALS